MEKYGFVYIWYDRKNKRFYIGCRWGNTGDGYICSSPWMRKSYSRRPQDFRRRILATGIKSKQETLEEEYKWMQLISDDELGKKYYNLQKHHFGHWSVNEQKSKSVVEKRLNTISNWSEETKAEDRKRKQEVAKNLRWITKDGVDKKVNSDKIDDYLNDGWQSGRSQHTDKMKSFWTDEKKSEMSEKHKSVENGGRMSKGNVPWNKDIKGQQIAWNKGKTLAPDDPHRQKLSELAKQRQDYNAPPSQKGSMWITNGIINKKISKETIIPDGWKKGMIR
jgi:hypothetical protein